VENAIYTDIPTSKDPVPIHQRIEVLQRDLAFEGVTSEQAVVVVIGYVLDFYCHKAGFVVKTQSAVRVRIKVFVEEKKECPTRALFSTTSPFL